MSLTNLIMAAYHLIECIFQFSLFRIFAAFLEKMITVFGQELRGLAAWVSSSRHRVVVDELATGFVERRDEAVVVWEGSQDEGVIFLVYLQDCAHVKLGILEKINSRKFSDGLNQGSCESV